MSLDDLRIKAQHGGILEPTARRVDRSLPQQARITRAEELRLQLADEIVRGALAPGARSMRATLREVSACQARRCAKRCGSLPPADSSRRAHRGAVVARPTS